MRAETGRTLGGHPVHDPLVPLRRGREGTLKLEDGTALLPNERYPLEKETFRLYFTPLSDEQSSFTVWVEDSDGQAVELEYDFNADNDKEDGDGTE